MDAQRPRPGMYRSGADAFWTLFYGFCMSALIVAFLVGFVLWIFEDWARQAFSFLARSALP